MIEIALKPINGKDVPAVTSLQVAEHFEKNHKDVLRDIRVTIEKCSQEFNERNFAPVEYTDAKGEKRPMYLLSKDGFMMLAMSYTTPEAMTIKEAYIARFNEMEKALHANAPASLPEALRAYAVMLEETALIRQQRDFYKRTKAEIGSRREATAMATASVAVRKVNALEDELGRGKNYLSVKAIPWFRDMFLTGKRGVYSVAGRHLSRISKENGLDTIRIPDPAYPEGVKAYRHDVVESFRRELERDNELMRVYRR